MRLKIAIPAALLLLAAAGPSAADEGPTVTVSDLAWLSGCWAPLDGEPGSGEQWTTPAGGTLLGMSRTIRDGKTVAYEFLQIRETEPGKLAYLAKPSGQPGAAFTLVRHAQNEAVFENLEHDFPQRVIYRLDGEGVLRARIEGSQDGRSRGVDFPMSRVSCAGEASPR